jgi:hypothetical protein
MGEAQEGSVKRRQWLYLFMCSLNVATVVVTLEEMKGSSVFLGILGYPLDIFLFPLLRRIYRDNSFRNGYLVYILMCLLLATIIFALLRVLNVALLLRPVLLVSAGIAGVAGYPVLFLWLRSFYRISQTKTLWLVLETGAAAVSTVLYLYRRWPLPQLLSLSLLVAHFCFWGWVSYRYVGLLDVIRSYGFWSFTFLNWVVLHFAFALPGFLATLSWAKYLSPSGGAGTDGPNDKP